MPGATGSAVLPPDRPGSPGSLIVSFAGSYLRQLGGWIAVADLIRALRGAQLSEPSVRQALVRLKSRGFLQSARRGGVAGYQLTDAGLQDLITGDRRIFRRGTATEEDGWALAVFSVPESDRHLRHQLRTELAWLGFGTVSPGVWIAPRPLAEPTRKVLLSADLDRFVTWFDARHLTEIDVAAWWDLPALRSQYESFVDRHRRDVDEVHLTDEQAFARYLRLVDAWRMFPRLDPGLPESLLPPRWPATAAWEIFSALHERWADAGLRHVREVVAGSSEVVTSS